VRISLSNKLALLFAAVTLFAIGALYLYVAPGLQTRLIDQKLSELASVAHHESVPIAETVGGRQRLAQIRARVNAAAADSGARVTLLSVARAVAPYGPQLSRLADSSNSGAMERLAFPTATRAVNTGAIVTGTERTPTGTVAEAAYPISYQGDVVRVIEYSNPVSDVHSDVVIVRREILIAGGIALLLALGGGYLVARALAARVKRLERAAERITAGDFEHPIPVDSTDELGQLAAAFNEMQRQLAQLELARKKFIATASHELRTPIFSLGGFVELLEDDELDAETRRRFLDQVHDQVERLRKLSVDLLDLSKLDAGALELRPEDVDLGELTRSVSGEFEPVLAHHDAHLELRLSTKRIDVHCDPVRVAQIMRILIDNALTHNPPGTRITVTAGRDNGYVRLAVRDDGEGIEPEAMPRIFEPFYTVDDAQGSGLGLAIASELAGRMDGSLSAQSAPGDTVFTLELPS
jgi:signal transduction histidine kinase